MFERPLHVSSDTTSPNNKLQHLVADRNEDVGHWVGLVCVFDPLIKTDGELETIKNSVRAGRAGEWKLMDGRSCPFSLCVWEMPR